MGLTAADLAAMLEHLRTRQGDTTEVEVKLGAGGCPTLGPTLSAFGNMPGGGTILIGLDEGADFAPVGVEDPAAMESAVASQARTAVTPPVQVTFEEALIDGAVIVVVRVLPLPGASRPSRYQGNAYLRQADGDYVMSDQEVQQLLAMRDRPRHDAVAVDGTTPKSLDSDLTREFLMAARAASRRLSTLSDEEVLQRKGVLAVDGVRLTLAGLYALGEYPQQFMPSLSITAAVQLDPRSGARTRDLVHLDGPVPILLEDAMSWVTRNTSSSVRYEAAGHARDVSEIPAIAVRELVANALVHRDLSQHSMGKRVEIRLTNDLLVIGSPGGLWGINSAQLGTPAGKSAVNEHLYDICRLARTSDGARVIEGEGGGIREAERALSAANHQPAKFVDKGVSFTVLVPRHSLLSAEDLEWLAVHDPHHRLSNLQRRIAASMRHGTTWTNAMVREEFAPIDSTVARAELQGLMTVGIAQADGERNHTAYSLAAHLLPASDPPGPTIVVRSPRTSVAPEQQELPLLEEIDRGEGPEAGPSFDGQGSSGAVVWQALAKGPMRIAELVASTGLTEHQVRYALRGLDQSGWVTVNGGWGVRGTTYQRRISRVGSAGSEPLETERE